MFFVIVAYSVFGLCIADDEFGGGDNDMAYSSSDVKYDTDGVDWDSVANVHAVRLKIAGFGEKIMDLDREATSPQRFTMHLAQFEDGEYRLILEALDQSHNVIELHDSVQVYIHSIPDAAAKASSSSSLPLDACPVSSSTPSSCNDCGDYGHCVQGVCVCQADHIGTACEHSMLNHTTFIPDVDPWISPSRCQQSNAFEKDSYELWQALNALQNRCHSGAILRFDPLEYGFAAQVHFESRYLTTALQQGKAMLIAPIDTYKQKSFALHAPNTPETSRFFKSPWVCDVGNITEYQKYEVAYACDDPYFMPVPFENHGVFWWRMQLVNYLLRPTDEFSMQLRRIQNRLRWQHPVIGVHVRHGDACAHAQVDPSFRPSCKAFALYIPHILAMKHKYNVHTVFLATDDADVVYEAVEFGKANGIRVVFNDIVDRAMYDSSWLIEDRMASGIVDANAVAEATWIDTMLLGRCDYFVGGFSSQLSRLALELIAFRLGFVPPYASVDYPWCSAPCLYATDRTDRIRKGEWLKQEL